MNAEVLYLIATLCLWGGFAVLFSAAIKGAKLWIAPKGERAFLVSSLRTSLIIGAILVLIATFLPKELGRELKDEGLRIPVVWLMLSFPGWLSLAFLGLTIGKMIQMAIAMTDEDRKDKLGTAIVLAITMVLCFLWHSGLNEPVAILRGAIVLQPLQFAMIVLLAIGAILAMVAAERAIRSKGLATKLASTAALIVGSIVFGFPFVWLLLTSFKEERDLSMTDGIMWVPMVQLEQPFTDPERPLAEARYQGRNVQANVIEVLPGGRVKMEVDRPYGLRGRQFEAKEGEFKPIPRMGPMVSADYKGTPIEGFVWQELDSGNRMVEILKPESLKGQRFEVTAGEEKPIRVQGLRWQNYQEAIEWMPFEANYGLTYLKNTMILVILGTIGTLLSCSIVAYGFSRLSFPGRKQLFLVMLATMMLPGAVTMLPSFLIFRSLGWIDTLKPLWVPAFFAGAFNVFLINQFFQTIPMELEDAAKIDGCSYLRTFWQVMLPQIKPVLAAIAIWTFMGTWNNFMGPLIYISSPENMPLAYALQLFNSERGGSFGLMMAFATMATVPVIILFFTAQRWFIEGVQLSGLGGR